MNDLNKAFDFLEDDSTLVKGVRKGTSKKNNSDYHRVKKNNRWVYVKKEDPGNVVSGKTRSESRYNDKNRYPGYNGGTGDFLMSTLKDAIGGKFHMLEDGETFSVTFPNSREDSNFELVFNKHFLNQEKPLFGAVLANAEGKNPTPKQSREFQERLQAKIDKHTESMMDDLDM